MAGFIFGGDTGTSAADLAKRRKIIDELTKNATARMPRDIGEGIYSLGTAIVGRVKDKKLKPMEDAERARLGSQFDAITSGLMGGQPPMGGTSYAAPMSEADQIGADTMAALGKDPASMVRQGLIDRGLPEHIADGFVMNFQDESGLNPGINEISPIVPGSRGGFGLAQWTGPRRRALESFAASQGKPVSDQDVQLDFLMTELQGPESAAWREISGAQDAGQAGAAIVNSFLRPAEQHRAAREARYTGGQGTMSAKNGGGNPAIVSQLVELMQNPYASDSQRMIAQQLLGTQMAQMGPQDPMQAIELERAQLELEALRNPQAKPAEFDTFNGPDGTVYRFNPATGQAEPITGAKTPEAMPRPMTPEERASWGIPLEDTTPYALVDGMPKAIGGGGVTVNNNGSPVEPLGTEGQILVPDANAPGGYRVEIAPGSKLDQERIAADAAAANAGGIAQTTGDTIVTAATRARGANNDRILGGVLGALAAYNPSTPSAEVYRQTDSLKSIASIENITAMRRASPTGAALGAASDKDIELLKQKHGALDPASPNYERDLLDYTKALLRTVHGVDAGDQIFGQTFGGAAPTAGSQPEKKRMKYNPTTGEFE